MASGELEIAISDVLGGGPSSVLCAVHEVSADVVQGGATAASIAALEPMLREVPRAVAMMQSAAAQGSGLAVVFPPAISKGLADGSLRLMQTSTGTMATAVSTTTGKIAGHGRLAAGAAAGGAGITAGALAVTMLPVVIAGAAAYAQQAKMEQMLQSIEKAVRRIEIRLEDTDHGICDSAETFITTALDALSSGPLPAYLRSELAVHRAANEALYAARLRFVRRLKAAVEKEQIAYESKKGERQPWVDTVEDMARSGQLEQEVVLFVRALMCQAQLDALAAGCIAEDGAADVALRMLERSALELRSEFFDLHNRLRPLAAIAPPASLRSKVPLVGDKTAQAHETAKVLVDQLDRFVLPNIPDPHDPKPVVIELSPAEVVELVAVAA